MKFIDKIVNVNKWMKFLIGSTICALGVGAIVVADAEISVGLKKLAMFLAIPGAFALVGLLEIITGSPFYKISDKWDELRGWQRGVIGTLIVVIVFFIMAFAIVLFA